MKLRMIIVAVLIFCAILITGCVNDSTETELEKANNELPTKSNQEVENDFEIVLTELGIPFEVADYDGEFRVCIRDSNDLSDYDLKVLTKTLVINAHIAEGHTDGHTRMEIWDGIAQISSGTHTDGGEIEIKVIRTPSSNEPELKTEVTRVYESDTGYTRVVYTIENVGDIPITRLQVSVYLKDDMNKITAVETCYPSN